MSERPLNRWRDFSRYLDARISGVIFPYQSPGARWARIVVALAAIAVMVVSSVAIGYHSRPATAAVSTAKTSSAGGQTDDFFVSYRHKASYLGTLEGLTSPALSPGTYYVPNTASLIETGNYEWFIDDGSAPVLKKAADAGKYPFKLTVIEGGSDYMFAGGAALVLTLPNRYNFLPVYGDTPNPNGITWEKGRTGPNYDLRDISRYYAAAIPLAQVLPSPGLKLSGYFDDSPTVGSLAVGKIAWIDILSAKFVQGTHFAYLEDTASYPKQYNSDYGGYLKITRTSSGLVVCPTALGGWGDCVVPNCYQPLATERRATVSTKNC